ncbi:Uncharacterised protein [Mycobacteroides abscessus subsp. abscessus]|nr:Uncharacterised protein [Mycobacteroides abscessus subsp. abscessus]
MDPDSGFMRPVSTRARAVRVSCPEACSSSSSPGATSREVRWIRGAWRPLAVMFSACSTAEEASRVGVGWVAVHARRRARVVEQSTTLVELTGQF